MSSRRVPSQRRVSLPTHVDPELYARLSSIYRFHSSRPSAIHWEGFLLIHHVVLISPYLSHISFTCRHIGSTHLHSVGFHLHAQEIELVSRQTPRYFTALLGTISVPWTLNSIQISFSFSWEELLLFFQVPTCACVCLSSRTLAKGLSTNGSMWHPPAFVYISSQRTSHKVGPRCKPWRQHCLSSWFV